MDSPTRALGAFALDGCNLYWENAGFSNQQWYFDAIGAGQALPLSRILRFWAKAPPREAKSPALLCEEVILESHHRTPVNRWPANRVSGSSLTEILIKIFYSAYTGI